MASIKNALFALGKDYLQRKAGEIALNVIYSNLGINLGPGRKSTLGRLVNVGISLNNTRKFIRNQRERGVTSKIVPLSITKNNQTKRRNLLLSQQHKTNVGYLKPIKKRAIGFGKLESQINKDYKRIYDEIYNDTLSLIPVKSGRLKESFIRTTQSPRISVKKRVSTGPVIDTDPFVESVIDTFYFDSSTEHYSTAIESRTRMLERAAEKHRHYITQKEYHIEILITRGDERTRVRRVYHLADFLTMMYSKDDKVNGSKTPALRIGRVSRYQDTLTQDDIVPSVNKFIREKKREQEWLDQKLQQYQDAQEDTRGVVDRLHRRWMAVRT